MRIKVNGARLYFDVEGAGLAAEGRVMREKPTLIVLHGGPGADHSLFKPQFSAFADIAQVIYVDHRGNGRSDQCGPETWTLAQWGDDVRGLCDALEIERPIVYGVSFGGFVAQAYATRHPDHLGKLVLTSTAAKFEFAETFAAFERVGGPEARAAAEGYWLSPSSESRAHYGATCLKYYSAEMNGDPDWIHRIIMKDDVAIWFNGIDNEQGRMDFRADLGRIRRPVMIMSGARDPVTPPAFSDVIAESLTAADIRYERFPDAGHGVFGDAPEAATTALRDFIAS